MKEQLLNQEQLKEILNYNPDTGVFTWNVRLSNRAKAGSIAGTPDQRSYRRIKISGKQHLSHRLAWLYVYGEWPKNHVDHISGDTSDNRIVNLRDVTRSQNQHNRSSHRAGRLVGTSFDKRANKWQASLWINSKKKKHLGLYPTELEAHNAYITALNQFQCS